MNRLTDISTVSQIVFKANKQIKIASLPTFIRLHKPYWSFLSLTCSSEVFKCYGSIYWKVIIVSYFIWNYLHYIHFSTVTDHGMHNTGTYDWFLSGLACQTMIHFCSKYLILQRGKGGGGGGGSVKSYRTTIPHSITEHSDTCFRSV